MSCEICCDASRQTKFRAREGDIYVEGQSVFELLNNKPASLLHNDCDGRLHVYFLPVSLFSLLSVSLSTSM